MKTTGTNKILIPLVTVFIVGMFIYNFFFSAGSAPMPGELSAADIGDDLVAMRTKLEEVNFERDLFLDQKFLELADFSTVIPQQPTGRPNPFNIIGRD